MVTLFKWKWLILGLGLLMMTAAGMTLAFQPVAWSATAKVLLKNDRGPLQVPGPGFSGKVSRGPSIEELTTEMEFLESTAVLLPVVRALRAAQGEPVDVKDGELRSAVDRLRARIVATPVPNTTVFQVTYSADSRTEGEHTLGIILDHYIEQHAVAYSGGAGLTAFYDREVQQTAEGLRQAEDRLRQWQDANNVVTVEGQLNTQVTLLTSVETNLKRTEVEIGGVRAAIATLSGQVTAQPERSVASRQRGANPMIAKIKSDLTAAEAAVQDVSTTPLVSRLRTDLVAAQIALNDLRQRYNDPERRVVEKMEQISLIERELATAERAATAAALARVAALKTELAAAEREGDVMQSETVAPNPLREGLLRELAGAQARLTSLLSQADALRVQMKEAENGLVAVRNKRTDFERLSRDVELAKALYIANSKRLDDSRIVAGLEKRQFSPVAVIEGPRASGGMTTTRQATIVVMAGVVGLGLGVAAAFAAELLNGTLRTPQEVEFYLGIPVVAAVPAIREARTARALPIIDVPRSSQHRGA